MPSSSLAISARLKAHSLLTGVTRLASVGIGRPFKFVHVINGPSLALFASLAATAFATADPEIAWLRLLDMPAASSRGEK